MATERVCFVLQFGSIDRAIEATDFLYGNEVWVQRFGDRVAVYVPPGHQPPRVEKAALHALREGGMGDQVLGDIRELVWNANAQCFVDPADPGVDGLLGTVIQDAEFDALDSKWQVTVHPRSILVHRAVRGELVSLRRPFLDATGDCYVLGALNAADAEAVVKAALTPGQRSRCDRAPSHMARSLAPAAANLRQLRGAGSKPAALSGFSLPVATATGRTGWEARSR